MGENLLIPTLARREQKGDKRLRTHSCLLSTIQSFSPVTIDLDRFHSHSFLRPKMHHGRMLFAHNIGSTPELSSRIRYAFVEKKCWPAPLIRLILKKSACISACVRICMPKLNVRISVLSAAAASRSIEAETFRWLWWWSLQQRDCG